MGSGEEGRPRGWGWGGGEGLVISTPYSSLLTRVPLTFFSLFFFFLYVGVEVEVEGWIWRVASEKEGVVGRSEERGKNI